MSDYKEFKGKQGLVRLFNALGYSRDGLCAAWKNEAAFREETLLAAVTIPLAFVLGQTGVDRALPATPTEQETMGDYKEFKGKQGIVRLINALGYSRDGLASAWKNEAAFREETLLAAVAIPLAIFLGQTGVDRALLIGSILLILIVEILNSGLEAVVDKASPEKHELAKRAKDMGSAAVLLSLVNAAVIWACVLWPAG